MAIKNDKLVVVLGAAGYIGSTLIVFLLKDGYRVRAVDNFYKGSCDSLLPFVADPNFEFMFGDVTDFEHMKKALDGANFVWNGAGIVGFPKAAKYRSLAYETNVTGMKVVLDAKPYSCRLVNPGTGSTYGSILDGECTEETPLNPLSWYGETKMMAEELALQSDHSICHRYSTLAGIGYNATRVNLLLNDLTYQAVINRSITVFQADFRRSFSHVFDVCRAILHTIRNFDRMIAKHRIYNVGSHNMNATKREIAEMLKVKTGCYVTYAETATDLDQRNYGVNFDRLHESGWQPLYDMEYTVNELIKATPLLTGWKRYD